MLPMRIIKLSTVHLLIPIILIGIVTSCNQPHKNILLRFPDGEDGFNEVIIDIISRKVHEKNESIQVTTNGKGDLIISLKVDTIDIYKALISNNYLQIISKKGGWLTVQFNRAFNFMHVTEYDICIED